MYPCHYLGCKEEFTNHTFLMNHILRDHGNSRVNWNSGIVAAVLGVVVALSVMLPVRAQSVGEPPVIAVEHKLFLPFVAAPDDVSGQGRYWDGMAEYVSWCPSCSPRK